ncbi:putative ubiquitin carboxyl-terminal hydrolase 2 [Golovinomyces cichoracearum]|uniref:ubiquitinyl hydrolase 1 n=1 Tax=Golovinomyces cichoracearum TaxID=62708 RepID=A0A420IMN9_9PEZI|nr:putative ubiquitin carboxyl-terminal hydrolase 2 [Golovinomyces cichoracearum]
MATSVSQIGPGKTPPRLISDLLNYVPRLVEDGYNLLADPAQQFQNKPLKRRSPNDCRHNLMRKDSQTQAPISDDISWNSSSQYFVSAICSSCRHHFKISVSVSSGEHNDFCNMSQSEYPLHHLILTDSFRIRDYVAQAPVSKYHGFYETFEYSCTRIKCPIVVKIKITPPRLEKSLLQLIEDAPTLEKRGIKEIRKDPSRFSGQQPVDPFTALKHLASYLSDALHAQWEPRKIAARNKKFRLSFSDDCNDIFNYLDFFFFKDQVEGDDLNYFWRLPLVTDKNRDFLEDVLQELTFRASEVQPQTNNAPILTLAVPAMEQIKIILGFGSFPEKTKNFDANTEEHPYYASLGAVEDFTDELLCWAYDRQCECDPKNKPYYFDCLEDLARGRKSYYLQTKFVVATSAGGYGNKAIEDAYSYFRLQSNTNESDEFIMSLYKGRVESEPSQKNRARGCLEKIARHRNSPSLEALIKDQDMTLDEALEFLGVNIDTSPEFIEASAVALLTDGDKSKVALALKIIAKQKPGDMILQRAAALMAAEIGEACLSISDAYKMLQIPSREISDEGVLNYFQSLSNVAAAGSKENFCEALRLIALDRSSTFLLAKLADPNAEVSACAAEPLGLYNIGNTCYLNSLLQYFYSVKPLREMVMNFDNYRMVINDENMRRKKVGGRQVEKTEIIKAQKFVEELQKLFIDLKTASSPSVRPTKELAALTIFSTQAAEEVARKNSVSSINQLQDNAQKFESLESAQPSSQLPLQNSIVEEKVDVSDHSIEKTSERGDNESEITLVNSDICFQNASDENKDIEPVQTLDFESDSATFNIHATQDSYKISPAPDRPPPVPPRNNSEVSTSKNNSDDYNSVNRLWDFGTQQDVTEVIGNVLFRLQCAITATDYEFPSGEQVDVIRDTFFGANTVYTQKAQILQKKVEAWSYLLVFPAKSLQRSIYEALDISFDEQMVEIDGQNVPQFTSISKLPRIMQFHIQRTAFDQTNLRSWKNRTPVTIPETLYLDRYIDDSENPNSTVMNRRRQTWTWKKELTALEARYEVLTQVQENLNVPDALIATRDWINEIRESPIDGISINPDLPYLLENRIAEVTLELNEISGKIEVLKQKLQNQFIDMCELGYTLHAVFIHQGEAGGGHYWVYIYDSNKDIWRKYNDENVSEVKNRDYIFKHESVGRGTPYYVVYVQSSLLKEMVDPVFRDLHQTKMKESSNISDVPRVSENLTENGLEGLNTTRHIENIETKDHYIHSMSFVPEDR